MRKRVGSGIGTLIIALFGFIIGISSGIYIITIFCGILLAIGLFGLLSGKS